MTEVSIRRVTQAGDVSAQALDVLLQDAVNDGASMGFLPPLSAQTAQQYWEAILASLGDGLMLWVAEIDSNVVGAVQLAPCMKENGRHRADVQKLLVLRGCRGQGIARRLMDALENAARADRRSTLVLDTLAGSDAEMVYRNFGWQRVGEIPQFARVGDGSLQPTAYYYKLI